MGHFLESMEGVIHRLRLQMLRAKLALCQLEHQVLVKRIQSPYNSAEDKLDATNRLAVVKEEIQQLRLQIALNMQRNGPDD